MTHRGRKRGPGDTVAMKIHMYQNPRWRRWPFWNQLNGDKLANIERILTKFDTETGNRMISELALSSQFIADEFQDGGGRYIGIHIFGPNWAIIAYICTEFDTVPENVAPESDFPP